MFNKRGAESETVHVTGLIILMGVLIILYMLLIPPEAQREILEKGELSDNYDYTSSRETDSKTKNILLESPGLVFPESNEKEDIEISSVNLFSVTSQKITSLANSLSVTRSLPSNNFQDLSF